jgi:protein gp37
MTKIQWTDQTWNPIVGCSVVSPGCTNCYAMRMAGTRLRHTPAYRGLTQGARHQASVWNGKVRFLEERLTQPLKWRKPRRVFVNSMGDLFHENVADDDIDRVFAIMAMTPQHTYQVLTKRPERMRKYTSDPAVAGRIWDAAVRLDCEFHLPESHPGYRVLLDGAGFRLPLPNIWLGTSVEDQKRANERIPHLLNTPAAVRFLSMEPLLEEVDLYRGGFSFLHRIKSPTGKQHERLDWIICGGESGPSARDMDPAWARSLRDQCQAAGVPFFMKQMSRKTPIPNDLMVREWPG